jgi:hypothetical protein
VGLSRRDVGGAQLLVERFQSSLPYSSYFRGSGDSEDAAAEPKSSCLKQRSAQLLKRVNSNAMELGLLIEHVVNDLVLAP